MVCELGKLLAERYNVVECSFDALNEQRVFANGNQVVSLGVKKPTNLLQRLAWYVLKAYRLNMLKRRLNIDATISNLWPADFINVLSMGKGKNIALVHHPVIGDEQNRLQLTFQWFTGAIYRQFDQVAAVNPTLMAEFISLFDLANRKCNVIHNFVEIREISPRLNVFASRRKRLVWFGRLTPGKNLRPLLEILHRVRARLQDVQLVVIGTGDEKEALIEATVALGLTVAIGDPESQCDVLFLGFVQDPLPYLVHSDLFVMTSKAEGFGLVLVEAMAAGLPILASDCPAGGPHLVMDGSEPYRPGRCAAEETPYGYLMPIPESGDGANLNVWEDVITTLLEDDSKRATIGRRCKERAVDFSKDRIKTRWFELLDAS